MADNIRVASLFGLNMKKKKPIQENFKEYEMSLALEDSEAGRAILNKFILLLSEVRHDKAYYDGWIFAKEDK